jgi:hypothetical protein
MKRLICATLVGLLLGATTLTADTQGHGKKHKKQERASYERDSVSVHVVFAKGDVVILRDHYASRYRNLPPGLQKKVARGGQLPPGWRKKFEPFPVVVERRLTVIPRDYRRGVMDGHAVIYNARTHAIVDVAVLF